MPHREEQDDRHHHAIAQSGHRPVKCRILIFLAEVKPLSGVAERLMSLSLTDNRGFEADQLTITLDDADGQLRLPPRARA